MTLRKATSQNDLMDTEQKNRCANQDDRSSSSNDTSRKNDQRSSSHESGSNSKSESSRTGTTEDETMLKEELARHETNNVFRLRIIVIIIMVTVAAAVSYLIYDITHKAEITAFETEFEGNAELIIASLNGKLTAMSIASLICDRITMMKKYLTSLPPSSPTDIFETISAIAGFAVSVSVEADVWPFVTLAAFHMRARNVAGADYITLNPIVQAADLPAWESYVLSPVNAWM